jgi:hypothetical protein
MSSSSITLIRNFVKIGQLFQNFKGYKRRQHVDFRNMLFTFFFERRKSRLVKCEILPQYAFKWPIPFAARFLGMRFRIPPGAWKSVCCVCYVLSGRGLCAGLITCPEESYRVWCVWVWSWSLDNEEVLAHWGLLCHGGMHYYVSYCCHNK